MFRTQIIKQKNLESTHIYVSLLFIKYISVWQKMLDSFIQKQSKKKPKQTKTNPQNQQPKPFANCQYL